MAATPRRSLTGEVRVSVDVGDRVWVGGTKSGVVVFVGPTQFAVGEWVGVELDDAVGKNDGSVNGVRYFTCSPLHGVFAKAAKLMKQPAADDAPESGVASAATSQSSINVTSDGNGASKLEIMSPSDLNVTAQTEDNTVLDSPSSDLPVDVTTMLSSSTVSDAAFAGSSEMPPPLQQEKQTKRGMIPRPTHGSIASLHQGSVAGSFTDLTSVTDGAVKPSVKVGDRVVVSGHKVGMVRYVGTTEFAEGDWVGVELDEARGKNDGSVQGKR